MNTKKFIIFILWIIFVVTIVESKILRYKYFAESLRLDGGSGKIYTLNSYTIQKNKVALGIHRFDLSINYGATKNTEVGIKFNLQDLRDFSQISQNITTISPYLKYQLIDSPLDNPIDLSLGIYRTSGVIIVEKLLPKFYSTSFSTNFFISLTEEKKFVYTFSISKYTKWIEFIIDTNILEQIYSFGIRCLLTPDIKLDLFILDLKNLSNVLFENFVFGITIRN